MKVNKLKIGIISDTHLAKHFEVIDDFIDKNLSDVDMIFHLGDFKTIEVVERIKKKKKFIGVLGNNDDSSIANALQEKEIIEIEGWKIGLYHGSGNAKTTLENTINRFKENMPDIIVFGHSHVPIIKTENGVLLLNPGSPFKKGKRQKLYSYIILDITKRNINASLNFFK
jgi:uncharacterized protein